MLELVYVPRSYGIQEHGFKGAENAGGGTDAEC